jgi:hypothetical protein
VARLAGAWKQMTRQLNAVLSATHSLFVLEKAEAFAFSDHDLSWSSLSRIEPGSISSDVDELSLSSHEHPRPGSGGAATADHHYM